MRIAVIGAGAMGSLACFLLGDAAHDVVIYETRRERAAAIAEHGVRVRGDVTGTVFPRAGRVGEAGAPYDAIILAVGAGDSGDALRPVSPFVHRDTVYLSMQDGDGVSALAALVGEDRAFAALAGVSAREDEDGVVEVEEYRSLVMAPYAPGGEEALPRLAEALRPVHPGKVTIAGDLERAIWRRMESAAAVSGLCAVSGLPPREARRLHELDRFCVEAAAECREAAAHAGGEGEPRPSPWEEAVWDRIKPPMLLDLEAGRKTEIEYLSGRVVERARAARVPAPVHGAILSLVGEISSGRHHPGEIAVRELKRRVTEERGMSLL